MKRLDIRAEAEVDVIEAAGWYESEREGLGRDFSFQVEKTMDRVAANPLQYQEQEPGTRMAMVDRFPYGVYFMDEGDRITVVGVLHLPTASRQLERSPLIDRPSGSLLGTLL